MIIDYLLYYIILLISIMDPLALIRQATIENSAVNLVDGYYIFGPYKIHESTETCFKRLLLFYFYNILLNFI